MSSADKLELHYYFNDDSHSMNAVVRNKCEAEVLAILIEIAETLSISMDISSEVVRAGGLRDFWKLLGKNNNQITVLLVIATIILSRIPMNDPEIDALEKEIKQLTIEEKKLNIKKLKLELQDKTVQQVDKKVIGKVARHVDKNLKIVKRRSNLYSQLSSYHKITQVVVNALDSNLNLSLMKGWLHEKVLGISYFLLINYSPKLTILLKLKLFHQC